MTTALPSPGPLILDRAYVHEAERAAQVFLTQPLGSDRVVDYSWAEVFDQARRMAAHLRGRGFAPGARIAMLSKNCAHFIIAELAIWMAGGTTVAIFPTETADTVRYVLEHSEASLLFVGKLDTWEQQRCGVPDGLPCIALPLAPANSGERWDDIIQRTPPLVGRPTRAPADLAMILYTSGSTGRPKGVMHSFECITRAAEGMVALTDELFGGPAHMRVLSYLPLAHVMSRAWHECAALAYGDTHLFFPESLDTFMQDLRRARPTTFGSVPRLWLKFQEGVFAKLLPAQLDRMLADPATGPAVARQVLAGLGLEDVRFAGSGSAPIPAELVAWYRRLGLNLLEAYGMTEDFAYSHFSMPSQDAPGHVGLPLAGVQARLSPEGELLVKSPGQAVGYYKQPELFAQCLTEDGFFRTGDLGELNADGLLRITGRVKELFKTAKGKYVAPAPIENQLNIHPLVDSAMVSGVGQGAPYALVVPAETWRARLADPAVRAQLETELAALLERVNASLPDYEKLCMLVVLDEPWTIDNGCLTPTMKVKRSRIEAGVAERLGAWYAAAGPVVWA